MNVTIGDKVKDILIESERSRGDDFYLIGAYIERHIPEALGRPFGDILLNHKQLGIPAFESITRARREIQKEYPELNPPKPIRDKRKEEREVYHDYYSPSY